MFKKFIKPRVASVEFRPCHTCFHFGDHVKHGIVVGRQCNGDPSGKMWAPDVAQKNGRCGDGRVWWRMKKAK